MPPSQPTLHEAINQLIKSGVQFNAKPATDNGLNRLKLSSGQAADLANEPRDGNRHQTLRIKRTWLEKSNRHSNFKT